MWITELDVQEIEDPVEKANAYDDVVTLYFSDPNIDGVLLWGFSDQHHASPDAALFEGPDYVVRFGLYMHFYSKICLLKALNIKTNVPERPSKLEFVISGSPPWWPSGYISGLLACHYLGCNPETGGYIVT